MPVIKSVNSALTLIQNDSSKILELTVGPHKVAPGQEIPRAEAQAAPQLGFSVTSDTYLVICVDIDAPFPGFGVLGPALHWIQPGLEHEQGIDGATKLSSSTPFIVNYAGPAPPPGSAPHRYIFLLYEQPADFDSKKYAPAGGKNVGIWKRMRYDLAAFEKEAKLGPVVAANYFRSK